MAQSNTVLESQLEYLSLSKPRRILYKITHFFTNIPKRANRWIRGVPSKTRGRAKGFASIFQTIFSALRYGDFKTRLSFIIMGFGLMTRKQVIRGVLYFLYELFFIFFMCVIGSGALSNLGSLGSIAYSSYVGLGPGGIDIQTPIYYDNSFTILLYSLIAIAFILLLVFLWYNQLADSKKLQDNENIGKYASDEQTLKNVLDKSYARTLLFIPIAGLSIFTILPIIMMILIAFTDYNFLHEPPSKLFDWVGFYNFQTVFSMVGENQSTVFLQVFFRVLLWTLVWAFFATFSNYFLGMIVAMIINIKGIKLKKLWRTILITTIAVPQFISLLLMSMMLADNGIVNSIIQNLGWSSTPIKFLTDPVIAKVTIILVNTWVGIPYTMLICTGLLMNIPDDLYESARIDGASPFKMYFKITLPYMLFVTGPYLINQFVGNINNFNVIYLLSGGGPTFTAAFVGQTIPTMISTSNVGQTDLLITWIYKLTTNASYDYGAASVLSILIFAIVAFFSLIFYNRSSANKDEEAFQ